MTSSLPICPAAPGCAASRRDNPRPGSAKSTRDPRRGIAWIAATAFCSSNWPTQITDRADPQQLPWIVPHRRATVATPTPPARPAATHSRQPRRSSAGTAAATAPVRIRTGAPAHGMRSTSASSRPTCRISSMAFRQPRPAACGSRMKFCRSGSDLRSGRWRQLLRAAVGFARARIAARVRARSHRAAPARGRTLRRDSLVVRIRPVQELVDQEQHGQRPRRLIQNLPQAQDLRVETARTPPCSESVSRIDAPTDRGKSSAALRAPVVRLRQHRIDAQRAHQVSAGQLTR